MSTRSMIFVEVKAEDMGKTLKPNKNLIYAKGLRFADVDGWRDDKKTIPEAEIDKVPATEITGKYIGIYHHWDGYPEGVGDTLLNLFNTYEDALNLMLYGSESTINCEGEIEPYWLRGCRFGREDTPPSLHTEIPKNLNETCWAEYVYLFKDGEWLFDETYGDKSKGYNWQNLADHLAGMQDKAQ